MGLPFENADYNEDEVGARKIPELTDVVLTNIQNDNVLVYNNGIWENQAQTSGITELNDIPGVTITSVQANQVLKYVGGVWVNSTDTDTNTDNLNDLTDTLLTTPFGDDEVLKYSGGKWKNGNIPIEKLSNVHISNLQDGETLRYIHANLRWENAYNIDTLNELSDVNVSSNLNNHVLKYNHTDGVYKNAFLNVTDLGDTNITTLANGNTLIYNNGEWSAGNISLSTFTNGTGISVTGTSPDFTITNTLPDQVVTFNTGTGINVSGTYPNFTITNTFTEADPEFFASPVGAVTAGQVTSWDAAYLWGDHAIQGYLKQANVYGLNGLTWTGVSDNELIRRTSSTTADGAGMTLQDTSSPTFPQTSYFKDVSYFGRHGLLTIPFGVNRFESTFAGYNQRIIPYSPILSSTTLVSGLYLHHLPSTNDYNVRVGVNIQYPSQDFQVGTTLYVNDTTGFKRVGIGIADPDENLEVDGSIQIDSNNTARLKFKKSGQNPYALGEIDAETEGASGGRLKFYTKTDGVSGNGTEKLRINNVGAIGIGGATYGASGQFLKSNSSGSAVSWDTPIDTTYTSGTGVSISPSNAISIGQTVGTLDSPSFNQLTLGSVGNNSGIINFTDSTNVGIDTVAQTKGILDGNNGGQLEFHTKVLDGGSLTKRMVIKNDGAMELYTNSGTLSILTEDGTSQQGFIYNDINGTRDFSIDSYSAVTQKGIRFLTQGVRRMRIGHSGELTFGTSNDAGSPNEFLLSSGGASPPYWGPLPASALPTSPTFTNLTTTLDITCGRDIYANKFVHFPNSSPDSAKSDIYCRNLGYYNGGPQNHMALRSRGAEVLTVYYDNQNTFYVWVPYAHYAAGYYPTSDDRIKSNEKPITQGVSVIEKLQPKIYDKHQNHRVPEDKEDNDLTGIFHFKESGFIAQEVDKIPELKHLVKYNKTNDLYALSYEGIIPYLVQSIKELNARIKTLESK